MKTMKILASIVVLSASLSISYAITNTVIAVSGTNLVLSWPSYGYESYLVQYRQTLNSTDSWSAFTNAYPANSTNRTTLTLYGIVPAPGGSGGNFSMSRTSTSQSATQWNPPPPPPNPWDTNYWSSPTQTAQRMSAAEEMDSSSDEPQTGFYRVFHIPDWLISFDGYQFDGPTFIPVDYALPDVPTNSIENSMVLINGQPTDNATFISQNISGTDYWGMGIFFDQLPNGTNTIQLLTTVRESDTLNDQTPYMVFSNAPQTIVISNFVTYLDWSPLILSNTYTFTAKSTKPNADWEIDIYDAYGYFVNYQTGHTSDGSISWTWDLTDYNGNSRKDDGDPFFYPYITIQANPDPAGWMPPVANQFPSTGDWIFSYMDKYYDDGTSNYPGATSDYITAINNMEGGPAIWNIGLLDIPLKYGRTYSQFDRDNSWDILRTFLTSWNNRNFYYFGHGTTNNVGADMNSIDSSNNITGGIFATNTSKAYLSVQWVQNNVTKNKLWGAMPFRFVFLDGCDTAVGTWPQAWGVPKQTVSADWYKDHNNNPNGYRPNAFVGWDVEIGGSKDWGTIHDWWQFRSFWMGNWSVQNGQSNDNLNDVFEQARQGSNWVSYGQLWAHLKIYGYQTMKFNEYNRSGDWP